MLNALVRTLFAALGVLLTAGIAKPQKEQAPAATSQELIYTFRTNAALADETYDGKRIAVTGPMERITGTKLMSGTDYYLEMSCGANNTKFAATFRFNEDDRKQLARLKVGQVVTVEGLCKGLSQVDEEGRQVVFFCDCQITNVRK